jgi:hypothetical protein
MRFNIRSRSVKRGSKDRRATAFSHLSGSATIQLTSGLLDSGFGPVFCKLSKNNLREPFLQFKVPSSNTTTVSHNGSQSSIQRKKQYMARNQLGS